MVCPVLRVPLLGKTKRKTQVWGPTPQRKHAASGSFSLDFSGAQFPAPVELPRRQGPCEKLGRDEKVGYRLSWTRGLINPCSRLSQLVQCLFSGLDNLFFMDICQWIFGLWLFGGHFVGFSELDPEKLSTFCRVGR